EAHGPPPISSQCMIHQMGGCVCPRPRKRHQLVPSSARFGIAAYWRRRNSPRRRATPRSSPSFRCVPASRRIRGRRPRFACRRRPYRRACPPGGTKSVRPRHRQVWSTSRVAREARVAVPPPPNLAATIQHAPRHAPGVGAALVLGDVDVEGLVALAGEDVALVCLAGLSMV